MTPDLSTISSPHLYAVCATFECAHEPDQLATAQEQLAEWGITFEQAITELVKRGVISA